MRPRPWPAPRDTPCVCCLSLSPDAATSGSGPFSRQVPSAALGSAQVIARERGTGVLSSRARRGAASHRAARPPSDPRFPCPSALTLIACLPPSEGGSEGSLLRWRRDSSRRWAYGRQWGCSRRGLGREWKRGARRGTHTADARRCPARGTRRFAWLSPQGCSRSSVACSWLPPKGQMREAQVERSRTDTRALFYGRHGPTPAQCGASEGRGSSEKLFITKPALKVLLRKFKIC